MMDFLKEWEEKLHIKITCSQVCGFGRQVLTRCHTCIDATCTLLCALCLTLDALQETEPMGTAGPLRLASDILDDGSGDPFFVLNR